MIAGQIRCSAPPLYTELLGKPHSFVAARTGHLRYVLCRHRRIRIVMRFDRMDPMTIGADWRLPIRLCNGLPVNALLELFRDLVVALATSQRDIELEDG